MESMERGGSTTSAQSPSLFQHLVALLESGRLIAEAFSISSACQSRVSGDTVLTSLELIFADESRFSQRHWGRFCINYNSNLRFVSFMVFHT